jgi:hypothetical protein
MKNIQAPDAAVLEPVGVTPTAYSDGIGRREALTSSDSLFEMALR